MKIYKITEPRESVVRFSKIMEKKLQDNDYKGSWDACSPEYLLDCLTREVTELIKAIHTLHIAPVVDQSMVIDCVKECADVANFSMMISDIVRRTPLNAYSRPIL